MANSINSTSEYITLPIFPLIDFSKIYNNDVVRIEIINQEHKFSPDAMSCGTSDNIRYNPIFGSRVYINNIITSSVIFRIIYICIVNRNKEIIFPCGFTDVLFFNCIASANT